MLDILCVGEAKIDIFLQIPENDPHFKLDQEKENLLIAYGRKINIEDYKKNVGGNACNAAVGLSRLGKTIGLCAEIGIDEFSTFIINTLEKENLNISLLKQDISNPTPFSICLNYKGERTILSEHTKMLHEFNLKNTSADLIYLTSLGEDWTKVYQDVLDLVKREGKLLAFNPGTLQIKDRGRLIMELISETDYLFVNKEEAEILLYGKDRDLPEDVKDIKKILFGLKGLGAKNVVVTDSLNGSFSIDERNIGVKLDIIKVNVVEKTGAGDAYNAGFLAAILDSKNIQEAMVWGALNSSCVIQAIGAQKGLLTKQEIVDKLGTLGNYKTLPL